MTGKITHFRVGNGDMALIALDDADKTTILVDCNICECTDNDEDRDGRDELLAHLPRDESKRPYVDVMVLTHPDQDHCRGLIDNFHLGLLSEYNNDGEKIVIREMWSSPLIFRRRDEDNPLSEDATAWNTEAKRRVNRFRDNKPAEPIDGNRILIMGGDEHGHIEGAEDLVILAGTVFSKVRGKANDFICVRLLAPLPAEEWGDEELDKNHTSIIMQMQLAASKKDETKTQYLTGGDAASAVWIKLWGKYKNDKSALEYDLMLAPHHCSWGVISREPCDWGKGKLDQEALNALGVIRSGGTIVSSSKTIEDNDDDPPCFGAKKEYEKITSSVDGTFLCTADESEPIEFNITSSGPQRAEKVRAAYISAGSTGVVSTPAKHG